MKAAGFHRRNRRRSSFAIRHPCRGAGAAIGAAGGRVPQCRVGRCLHVLAPKALRVAVLVNPANPVAAETTCGMCGKQPASSGCKFMSSTPRRSARSMQPLPFLRVSAPMLSSSVLTHSLEAAAFN